MVLGTVFMLMGGNSRTVSQAVDKKLQGHQPQPAAGRHRSNGL